MHEQLRCLVGGVLRSSLPVWIGLLRVDGDSEANILMGSSEPDCCRRLNKCYSQMVQVHALYHDPGAPLLGCRYFTTLRILGDCDGAVIRR
jgi:hypothetical protein